MRTLASLAKRIPTGNGIASPKTGIPFSLALPSIGDIIFLSLLFVLVFSSGQGLLGDGDTGYHIRTGNLILRTGQVPSQDPYSLHQPPIPWTAHEWLSEIIMATVFNVHGLTGVVIFFAILLAITHWLLYQSLRSKSNDIVLCIIVTLLATATSTSHWLARPHVFSLLITVIWCHCLDRFQYRNENALMYLPFLMLLWVNLHGGFIIGLVFLAVYASGNFFMALIGASKSTEHIQKAKRLAIIFIPTFAVCMINPYGAEIFWFPFRLTSDRFIMDRVTEFMSPNFHEVLPFKYMLMALLGALALSRSALNSIQVTLVLLLSYMALYSARHVSLFAIVLAPILLRSLESILRNFPDRFLKIYHLRIANLLAVERQAKILVWPVTGLLLIVGLTVAGAVRYSFSEKKFPVAAVDFLMKERVSGNMFNSDEFGDYVIFAAWPNYRVFMDGRTDMYGARFGTDYLRVANAQRGWKDVLEKFNITWVFFDTESPLTAALLEQKDWHPIYSDKVATVFIRKVPAHAELLEKYASFTLPKK